MTETSLFIFTRDLRLDDNSTFIKALKESKNVLPIFIFNPTQIKNNSYKSEKAIEFMLYCLRGLENQIQKLNSKAKLIFFYGDPEKIIQNLFEKLNLQKIYITKDYTPFAKERIKKIKNFFLNSKCSVEEIEDILLYNKALDCKYKVFTKVYNLFLKEEKNINKPKKWNTKLATKFFIPTQKFPDQITLQEIASNLKINLKKNYSPQDEVLKIINNYKNFKDYELKKKDPFYQTTELSKYLKFGVISIRSVYHAFLKLKKLSPKSSLELIRNLVWRDFYYIQIWNNADLFKEKIDLKNCTNPKFAAWCNGKTGVSFIDNTMKKLNKTGYINNRSRLIVASFLIKDLKIYWKYGELYLAQKLTDYDAAINNGNWRWVVNFRWKFSPWKYNSKEFK